jgi:hypothetical protein
MKPAKTREEYERELKMREEIDRQKNLLDYQENERRRIEQEEIEQKEDNEPIDPEVEAVLPKNCIYE